jgi:hypothetical protein
VPDAENVRAAARAIDPADALLITAGAGMGVDSGFPDFRGDDGSWNAYPAYRQLGLSFLDLGNPRWFDDDPHLAWGFYGHRLNLYRATRPHSGFPALLRFAAPRSALFRPSTGWAATKRRTLGDKLSIHRCPVREARRASRMVAASNPSATRANRPVRSTTSMGFAAGVMISTKLGKSLDWPFSRDRQRYRRFGSMPSRAANSRTDTHAHREP